jgi:hypothetical protein
MSVSFYGKRADGEPVMLDYEDPAYLNMASANARVFLLFLGLEPGEEPCGEVGMPEARRAVMRARATFDRRASQFTRPGSDTKRPGRVRVVQGGLDEDYLALRLDSFERFLGAVVERGATSVYWA